MNPQTALNTALTLHIAGFTAMAGAIFADFALGKSVDKHLLSDKPRSLQLLEAKMTLNRLVGIGGLLILVTGVWMVLLFHGSLLQMAWFRIKMLLVVLVLLNGFAMLRRGNTRLIGLLREGGGGGLDVRISTLRGRLSAYHTIEILLLLTIFALSVFKV